MYVGVFFLAWLGIGAVVGVLYVAWNQPAPGSVTGSNTSGGRDVVVGLVLAAVVAALAVVFTLRSGTRLVLSVADATLADRRQPGRPDQRPA